VFHDKRVAEAVILKLHDFLHIHSESACVYIYKETMP